MSEKHLESPRMEKDGDLKEIIELKSAGLSLLLELKEVSQEVKVQIKDIFDETHTQKHFLIGQLVDFLKEKNSSIFKADELIKNGHELGKSALINALALSPEDIELLQWFRQIRE